MPVTITHAKNQSVVADFPSTATVTVGNSSGGTNTVMGSDLVRPSDWNSAHNYTLQLTGSEIASLFSFGPNLGSTTGAGGITVGIPLDTFVEPASMYNTNSVSTNLSAGTWYLAPFQAFHGMDHGHINFLISYNSANFSHGVVGSAASTGAASRTAAIRHRMAIYSQGSGANSTRLESYWQGDCGISATNYITYSSTSTNDVRVTNNITYGFISQIDSAGNFTTTTVSTGGSWLVAASTMASTDPNSLITGGSNAAFHTGSLMMMMPFNTTLPVGDYWLGYMYSTESGTSTSGGGNYAAGTMFNATPAQWMLAKLPVSAFKKMGYATSANSSSMVVPWEGYLATGTSSATNIISPNDIRQTTQRLYWNMQQGSVGTNL